MIAVGRDTPLANVPPHTTDEAACLSEQGAARHGSLRLVRVRPDAVLVRADGIHHLPPMQLSQFHV